jgi:hypothetical protein
MSSVVTCKIDQKEVTLLSLETNIFRSASELTGLPSSPIKGGTAVFTFDQEEENDNSAVFAEWFAESGKTKFLEIFFSPLSSSDSKLTLTFADAQCIGYNVKHLANVKNEQNAVIEVTVTGPTIASGQSLLSIGT